MNEIHLLPFLSRAVHIFSETINDNDEPSEMNFGPRFAICDLILFIARTLPGFTLLALPCRLIPWKLLSTIQ